MSEQAGRQQRIDAPRTPQCRHACQTTYYLLSLFIIITAENTMILKAQGMCPLNFTQNDVTVTDS